MLAVIGNKILLYDSTLISVKLLVTWLYLQHVQI